MSRGWARDLELGPQLVVPQLGGRVVTEADAEGGRDPLTGVSKGGKAVQLLQCLRTLGTLARAQGGRVARGDIAVEQHGQTARGISIEPAAAGVPPDAKQLREVVPKAGLATGKHSARVEALMLGRGALMGEALVEFVAGLMDTRNGFVHAVLATPIERGSDGR